jgi:putative ABC transport system permease protein
VIGLSWRGLRQRAVSLAGAFVALALGVALTTASGVVLGASSRRSGLDTASAAALTQAATLLVMLAVIGAFVTVFIVASTFAFSVAQRRRELARLRLVGATPGQVSRLVLVEAAAVAVAAGIAGGLLGAAAVSVLVWTLSAFEVVPAGLRVPVSAGTLVAPAVVAATVGCVVAVAGAAAAARQASRVAPGEALRDAASDQRVMTRGRWITGVVAALIGAAMLVVIPLAPPDGRLPLALFVSQPLVVAAAMLAPVLVVPLTGVVTAPVSRWSAASGLLARQNLKAAVRRTASTAAPVLVLVGVAGSLLAGTQVLATANRQDARLLYMSDLIDIPARAPDLGTVSTVPGVATASRVASSQVQAQVNRTTRSLVALGVDPGGAPRVLGLGHVDGNLADLHGSTVAIGRAAAASYRLHLGDDLRVRLADGTASSLRVVAVFDGTPLSSPVLLPYDLVRAHRSGGQIGQPDAVHIRLAAGASPGEVTDRLTQAGDTVLTTHRYLAHLSDPRAEGMRIGALVLAVFALAYTFVAVANTTVMSFADRHREFVRLRVVGANRRQILRMVLWEALAIAITGLAFGAAVITISAGGLWAVLRGIGLPIPLTLPWPQLAAIAAAAATVVLVAAAAPAMALVRRGYHASDLAM